MKHSLEVDLRYKSIPIEIQDKFRCLLEIGDVVLRNWHTIKDNQEIHLGYEFIVITNYISYTGRVSDVFLKDAKDPYGHLVKEGKHSIERYRKKMLGRVEGEVLYYNSKDREWIDFKDIVDNDCSLFLDYKGNINISIFNNLGKHSIFFDRDMAKGLIMRLQNWIDNNTFRTEEEKGELKKISEEY